MKKKTSKNKFIDLGEKSELDKPTSISKKWYPSLNLKGMKFKDGIGKIGTAKVKFKITSVELREGDEPQIRLDLQGIQFQEDE